MYLEIDHSRTGAALGGPLGPKFGKGFFGAFRAVPVGDIFLQDTGFLEAFPVIAYSNAETCTTLDLHVNLPFSASVASHDA